MTNFMTRECHVNMLDVTNDADSEAFHPAVCTILVCMLPVFEKGRFSEALYS